MSRRALLVLLLVLAPMAATSRADVAPDSVRARHLAEMGRLWSAAEIFHPGVAARPGAWDSAFVRAVPAVRDAKSEPEFVAALDAMFAELNDPATHVARSDDHWAPSPQDPDPRWRWLEPGLLVVRANNGADFFAPTASARLESLSVQLERARTVVFDLRRLSGRTSYPPDYVWTSSGVDAGFVRERLQGPTTRSRAHVGWRGSARVASMYGSYWRQSDGFRYPPAVEGPALRLVVLVNADSWIPGSLFALQAAGTAAFVAEGAFPVEPIVPAASIPFGESGRLQLRTADLVMPDGRAPHADTLLAAAPADTGAALQLAIALARRGSPLPRATPVSPGVLPPARPAPESYLEMREPSLPWRLLAAARIWSRVEYWEAYRPLLGDGWDRAYEGAIPEFEAAADSVAYALAVTRFYHHIDDTHGFVYGPSFWKATGVAPPPVRVRMIEGVPAVTELTDSVTARAAGFEVGDVIQSVDGIPASERLEWLRALVAASNREQAEYQSAGRLLLGGDSTIAVVGVRDARGRLVERRVQRLTRWYSGATGAGSPVWKVLPGNLGYVDLARLGPAAVDAMFDALAGTRGIVFDLRGYPQGTGWAIAPRLTEREGVVGARFRTPIATRPRGDDSRIVNEEEVFEQTLPPARGTRYLRPTVMLVDERTISQAEHTGLFLEAANGTTFVGSRTAGANGDVTQFGIPGGLQLTITGHDVRHADGRQLQQVGLPLAVTVRPTLAGLRAGRDEVLEAGVRHLEARIAAAAKRR